MKMPGVLLILLLSYCCAPASGQDTRSLLWQISSRTMKKPSYLLGTIHMICPEDLVWTAGMKKSIAASSEVCLEMDMDEPSLMMDIAVGMMDNSGKQLRDYFTEEEYLKISLFVKDSLGMNISMFQQLKPMALQTLFATKAAGCANPIAYETLIVEEAKKTGKEITGLESTSEQLALFDALPADSIIHNIVSMSSGYEEERDEYRKMVTLYKKQDLAGLYQLIQRSKTAGDNMDAFLDERNRKWIDRMVEKMDQTSIFFAVGAGHLWGENGIISLLRKAGYNVAPIK